MASLTRREFLFLGVASGAAVGVGVVLPLSVATRDQVDDEVPTPPTTELPMAVIATFPRVRVAAVSQLREAVPVTFDYPLEGQSNVLVKMGREAIGGIGQDEDIVAYSRHCTHMGCVVEDFQADHGVLGPCPCHFSTFDLIHNGQVTLGQASQNLPQVLLDIDGDDIYATGVLRLVYGYANTLEGRELVGGAA